MNQLPSFPPVHFRLPVYDLTVGVSSIHFPNKSLSEIQTDSDPESLLQLLMCVESSLNVVKA